MSGMDDLIAFLRAQLDEDERVAKRANGMHRWWIDEAGDRTVRDSMRQVIAECPDTYDAGHIARWDPVRVLAEVEAKRRVLDECARLIKRNARRDEQGKDDGVTLGRAHLALIVVKHHAQPYAGRDGWREEWRA